MNWKQVKNLLLLLLTAVNILLLAFVYRYYRDSNFTDAVTAKRAAAILADSGITVESELLSVRNDAADVQSCAYDREDYLCYAAALLFGKEADGIYLLPSGIRAETTDGKVVTLGYDFSLQYISPDADKERLIAAWQSAKSPAEHESCQTEIDILEELLALPEGTLKNALCTHADGYTFITVEQSESGIPLYGMECCFGFSGGTLLFAEGKYCFGIPTEKTSEPLLNRINILFSEKERGKTGHITDIALCYTLYEDAQNSSLLFVPAYVLTYADGERVAVSALSGKAY